MNNYKKILIPVIGLLLSFVVCGLLLAGFDIDPTHTFISIFKKAFGSPGGISQTLVSAIPILMIACAVDLGRKSGIFNLGVEGQMIAGAAGAQVFGLMTGGWHSAAAIAWTLLGGIFFGVLWTLIPAVLKAVVGINEIVILIMTNQIASYLLGWLVRGPLKDPNSSNNQGVPIPEAAWLPQFSTETKIHFGLILVLVILIVMQIILHCTSMGYEISVVGNSIRSAKYCGISVKKTILATFLISGGIAGLAGANQVSGVHHYLTGSTSNGFGWTGLTVAMIAGENPFVMILVSVLYSALEVGALIIQVTDKVPMQLANVIQAVTVLFVICAQSGAILIEKKLQAKEA